MTPSSQSVEPPRNPGRFIAGEGKEFAVQLADWKQMTETEGQYFNAQRIDA